MSAPLPDYPMFFEANVHPALWGSESWEISAHPSGPSVIANGSQKGRTLAEAIPGFPLLMKVIDAKTRLSVQVHPNERTASLTGGEPKTEMWCALNEGFIYAGLKSGVAASDVEAAVKDGSFEKLLVRHETKPGDVFFIPGGLVHAIGDGTLLYEVQQSSNTTYRLYDWGRVGVDGKPRQLHVAESLKSIGYDLPSPEPAVACKCEFFDFRQVRFALGDVVESGAGFAALFFVTARKSVLLPAGASLKLEGPNYEPMFAACGGVLDAFLVRSGD